MPDRDLSPIEGGVKDPKTGLWVIHPKEPRCYTEFDGLSRYQWAEKHFPAIADEKSVEVVEQWTLHYDYSCGIGLHATIDVPYLTINAVNDFVIRFLEIGTDFRSARPLSYSHADIEYWGLESNAIIEPDEWHKVGSGDK